MAMDIDLSAGLFPFVVVVGGGSSGSSTMPLLAPAPPQQTQAPPSPSPHAPLQCHQSIYSKQQHSSTSNGGGSSSSSSCSYASDRLACKLQRHDQPLASPQVWPIEQKNQSPLGVAQSHSQALASSLRSVTTLAQGQRIHKRMMGSVAEMDPYLANLLISMYSRFGDLDGARSVFDKLRYPGVVSWNCIITAYSKNKLPEKALQLFRKMLQKGNKPNRITFLVILGACSSPENLAEGKWIHAYVVKEGFKRDISVCNALITMYSKCGDLKEAMSVFHNMQSRNLISWNAAIAAYCKHGEEKKALELFFRMQQLHIQPDRSTFLSLLGVFTSPESLAQGKEIHNWILDHGFHTEVSVCNALINMYNKCGAPNEAFLVFKQMLERDIISWTSMIDAYSHHGHSLEALKVFEEMQQKGIKPNKVTFLSVIRACAGLADLEHGKVVHSILKDDGFPIDSQLGNSLICMYGKCNAVEEGRAVFDMMQSRDAVSWATILHAYASNGFAEEALQLFEKLLASEVEPDISHYISALDACGNICHLEKGKLLHLDVSNRGFLSDARIGNALISMYSKCGALSDACTVFDSMQEHDVVSWNAIISAHGEEGKSEEAFNYYLAMQDHGFAANRITFLALLRVCTSSASLLRGRIIHARIVESGLDSDIFIGSALINMYGNCGVKEDAHDVFDQMESPDLSSWNALLVACCHSGDGEGAVDLFERMKEHAKPDKLTFLCILRACIILEALDIGKEVHAFIKHCGLESDATVVAALIDMYGKCKALEEASQLFEAVSDPDLPTYMAMLDAYSRSGLYEEAMQVFDVMRRAYHRPSRSMLVRIVGSFNTLAAIKEGKAIHSYIIESGFEGHLLVGNALLAMYANFMEPDSAQHVFNRMCEHDVISWTTMMNIHRILDQNYRVLEVYEQMCKELVSPDKITFLTLLHACTNLKSLTEGKSIHSSIIDAGYGCDVDLRNALENMYFACDASKEVCTL